MDMKFFARFLNQQLRLINQESYHKWNWSETVVYPYLVYSYTANQTDEIRNTFNVTINMFEHDLSDEKLLDLESDIRNQLDRTKHILDEAIAHVRVNQSMDIDTLDDKLKRREIQLTVKLDWIT